jgi:benzoate-CoA ligase
MSSGELLSAQLYNEWVNAFGGEVENRFGSAESAMGYLASRRGAVIPGSSGTVTPLSEVKLVADGGEEVFRGKPGVLLARVPAAGLQYVRERDKSRATFLGNDWINTGDLFIQDENDYFWFVGRANELIKVSGVWVSPFEVEQTLQTSPHVKECAVMGVEDENGLMNIWAYVALKDGIKPAIEVSKELKRFCKIRLAPHKFPRVIEFANELPKTGSGKIDRLLLRQRARENGMCKAPAPTEAREQDTDKQAKAAGQRHRKRQSAAQD